MKIRNIIIVNDYAYIDGGASKIAIKTAIFLSKYTDINIFLFAGSGKISDDLLDSDVRCYSLGMKDLLNNRNRIQAAMRGIYNLESKNSLIEYLKNFSKEDTIIHVHSWSKVLSSSIFDVLEKEKFKYFITLHDYFIKCPNGGFYNYKENSICHKNPLSLNCIFCNCDVRNYYHKIWRCIRQKIQNQIINKCKSANYIFVSRFQRNILLNHDFESKRSFVLPNFADVTNIHRVSAEKNQIYLFLGRLSEEKGVKLFCEAVTKAKVQAVVVGDGALKKNLEKKYPSINFIGWCKREDVQKWIEKTRCLLSASICYETFGLSTIEAQAYGIPCLVAENCAAKELVRDGVSGILFSVKVEEIVDAINRTKSDSFVEELSKNTVKLFNSSFVDGALYVSRLLHIYKS